MEIKIILEGINSRITEAEEWISGLEFRMVEITAEEQNKEKRMKRIEDNLGDFWDNIKCVFDLEESQKKKRKRKGLEKIIEEIEVKNFPNIRKEIMKSRKSREFYTG